MNHTLNEHGQAVIAIGTPNSPARIRVEYPDTLDELIAELREGLPVNHPNPHVIRAARFYLKHPLLY